MKITRLLTLAAVVIFCPAAMSAAEAPVEPGGYQAGLTILMKPPAGIRVFGPGLPTPPPGGKILADLTAKPAIKPAAVKPNAGAPR